MSRAKQAQGKPARMRAGRGAATERAGSESGGRGRGAGRSSDHAAGEPSGGDRGGFTGGDRGGFTDDERAAMRERARELKAEGRGGKGQADGEAAVLAKIAEMPEADRAMAERLHAIVRAAAPQLVPRTWYGMPAYARGADVVCFFQSARKFKTRYATLGFSDKANLDEGAMWPTAFALTGLTPSEEARIVALLKRAVG